MSSLILISRSTLSRFNNAGFITWFGKLIAQGLQGFSTTVVTVLLVMG
ncbi:hypothetical protein [Serratia sp. (in: enterobacteria)]